MAPYSRMLLAKRTPAKARVPAPRGRTSLPCNTRFTEDQRLNITPSVLESADRFCIVVSRAPTGSTALVMPSAGHRPTR